mgnify:CR=1 FL=1|tara:strand:- start:277 stop:438 length:162 start_codon:yes stop_codon:yes gene_type:complete
MKQKAKRNLLAKSLSSPMFRKRVTKSHKGKGSYSRKHVTINIDKSSHDDEKEK